MATTSLNSEPIFRTWPPPKLVPQNPKLEGALRVRAFAEQNALAMVEVRPAIVSGHSVTGELDTAQPLYALIENLVAGRLAMVPGTPDHWLPLVSVDVLVGLIAEASLVESVPDRLLALDRTTPNLIGLLSLLAAHLEARPPKHHMPMPLLALLLRLPGLARLMRTSPESLSFLQTTRFDTQVTEQFSRQIGLSWPPIADSILATARCWQTRAQSANVQPASA